MADARHVSECGSGLGILKEGWRSGPRGVAVALAVATVAGSLFLSTDAAGAALQVPQGERRALATEVGLLLRRADGGLLVADVGAGAYVPVTLSLFRQLRAGVPGAYRLLANLLAL